MKKYLIIILVIAGLISCEQGEEFRPSVFPGFTGAGNEATWVVYTHVVTDVTYVTAALAAKQPPVAFADFNAAYIAARQREVTQYSFKFFSSGEIALMGKDAENKNAWIKQPDLKWEEADDKMYISRNVAGTWENIITGYKDQANILFRFNKAYFGDTSAEKNVIVMEVLYSMFK